MLLKLTHLLFADDSLLFLEQTPNVCVTLKNIFQVFEKVASQVINFQKSALSFSPNASLDFQQLVTDSLLIPVVVFHEFYLGLPTLAGRGRKELFRSVKDRVWHLLNRWKEKLISQASKEVLIKSVIQAIPSYPMGVFQLPKSLCKELSSLCARFWWGKTHNRHGIHWLK